MERIVLRHLSGSKANQVEEFPLSHIQILTFGRDPSAIVKYDPDRDDLVGRQHAQVAPDPSDPTQFILTDLNSRNGTYVNKQRITGSTNLAPGDTIQFGPGGPEVQFDLEPRPPSALRPTRAVAAADSFAATITGSGPPPALPPTRAINLESPSSTFTAAPPPLPPSTTTGAVGKATVERMISQNIAVTKRHEGRKYLIIGGTALAAVLVLFVAVAGYLLFRAKSSEAQLGQVQKDVAGAAANAPMDATAIAKDNRNAVVKIDVKWGLISPEGGLVYHQYGCEGLPCYIELADGTIEPLLTYDSQRYGNTSAPINGKFTASGIVVSNDGFILTNRHVAFAWETPYTFPKKEGTLLERDGRTTRRIDISKEGLIWTPSQTKQDIFLYVTEKKKTEKIPQGNFNGRNDRLDVFFPGSAERNVAQQVKPSESQDVALIRVNLPGNLPTAQLNTDADSIKQGDAAFVLGYPQISIPVYGYREEAGRQTQQKEIFDPNMNTGNVGRLLRAQEASSRRQVVSEIGDVYQLAVNSNDAGYDGGPVFDSRGKVVGIFSIEKRLGVPITVAIPIRYGLDLYTVGGSTR